MTRRFLKAATVALLLAAPVAMPAPALAQSAIKVIVNDTAITTMDVQNRARLLVVASRISAGQAQKQAVDELIDEALRLEDAKRRGITVTDEQVDQAFASIASRSKLSADQLAQALGQAGVPARALKARLRAQLAWAQVVRARLRGEAKAEQDDLIAQMRRQEKNASDVTAEDFVLQRIVFTLPEKAPDAVVARRKQEAEQLRARFKGCDEGIALARTLKEVAVINVGRRLAAEVTPDMAAFLKDVPEGQLTKPEVTQQGIAMLAVCERRQVTGESAAGAASMDAEAMTEQGNKISADLTRELRQKANIVYR